MMSTEYRPNDDDAEWWDDDNENEETLVPDQTYSCGFNIRHSCKKEYDEAAYDLSVTSRMLVFQGVE